MKPSVIIDSREASTARYIADMLKSKLETEIMKLDAGDYLFSNGVAVERKAGLNLYNDLITNHLFEQLEAMCELYEKPVLLVEGLDLSRVFPRDVAAVCRGGLVTVLVNWRKVKLLFTSDEKDTAYYLTRIALRLGPRGVKPPPRFIRKGHTPKEMRSFMLQCIRGVGPKTAEKVLKKYPTFASLSEANLAELRKVLGSKASRVLYNVFHEVKE